MGFRLNIDSDKIVFDENDIISAEFNMDTPDDSNARSTDASHTLTVTGKVLTPTDTIGGRTNSATLGLAKWSVVKAEKADSYRAAVLQVIAAGQVIRKITFPQAFVVSYSESYGDQEGIGTFTLKIRQKKDNLDKTGLEGFFGDQA
ncbi:MAG: membrane-associated protease 1 [Clostridiales bacterium]|jgi:hypothetical protein|nr:membrane-associated protease 1 [Clostridiales bacterium]